MTRDGFIRTGSLEANNEADLEKRLLSLRLDLIRADVASQPNRAIESRLVERRDLILFCMQMAQLTRAGVPLLDALADLRDSVDGAEFREVIASLIEVIESGESLSQAMADFPRIFDTLFVSLVRAGEASGKLADVFESLTDTIKWQDELATTTGNRMLTPLIVGTVVLGVTIFLMVYLVPQLVQFLASIGEELPLHTRALIATSDFMVGYWFLWGAIPALLFIIAQILVRTNEEARYRWDKMK